MIGILLALLGRVPLAIAMGGTALVVAGLSFGTGHLYDSWIHDPAIRKEALNGYVARVELDAAQAKAAESDRLKAAGDAAVNDLTAKLQTVTAQAEQVNTKLEQEISDHEKQSALAGHSCSLSGADIDWLRH